jgi:hypothetical protein
MNFIWAADPVPSINPGGETIARLPDESGAMSICLVC